MGRQAGLRLREHEAVRGAPPRLARMATSVAFALVSLASAGAPAAGQQPGIDGPSKALEGRWRVELYLDKPSVHAEPMAGQINGEIDFSSMAWWNPSDRFGRHNLNLRSFFGNSFLRPANVVAFGPADTSMVTEVSGSVRGDSVGIDFIPRVDHGGMSLWGRFWGDSAKGRWYRRGNDGEGHFVLRRLSKDPVSVASIPDVHPTAVAAAPAPKPLTKAQARALARQEAAAKAKARADSIAVARAEAKKQAKAEALAKAAARDSARAQAIADAKARREAAAQAVAEAKKRDTATQTTVATNTAGSTAPQSTSVASTPAGAASPTAPAVASTASSALPNASPGGLPGAMPNAFASPASGTTATSRSARSKSSTPVPAASAPVTAPSAASTAAAPAASTAAAAAPAGTNPAGSGVLRVRIFDEASKKYFVTTYSLHLPDGHWMYGQLRTGNGADGFGPALSRPPGNYEIEITNFMCGDKLWFFKDRILKPVTIQPGSPADVTIDVNLADAPARPSLENKSGSKCAVQPAPQS